MRSHGLLAVLALFLVRFPGVAQDIVSAQSGVIHYSEGAVSVDGTSFEHRPATFPLLKEGSTLATEKGRVEIMLTPGVFLRLDEHSSVKMISAALDSTSVEFLHGSVMVDALAAQGAIPITLRFKEASVQFEKPGIYRIDSETQVLQAYSGVAKVQQQSKVTQVDPSQLYFFELGTDTKKFSDGTQDEFYDWARNRSDIVNEQNQTAQAEADDEADAFPDLGGAGPLFNYGAPSFPQIGPTYPYGGLLYGYNSYGLSPFLGVSPLLTPTFIVAAPYRIYRRPTSTSHWPATGVWASHHPTSTVAVNTWLATHPVGSTYIHPVTPVARPGYVHPLATPHVGAPGVHIGHR